MCKGLSSKEICGETGILHLQDPRHIETAWGSVVVVRRDGSVAVLHEKGLSAKLELLYSKSLFLVALNLAQSEAVSRCLTAPNFKTPCSVPQRQACKPLQLASILPECLGGHNLYEGSVSSTMFGGDCEDSRRRAPINPSWGYPWL